ncbi:MAG: hypothetical protein IJI14_20920 [Anaerolineaceae bacterium]|nr:hypothetical protein [Anaerolineaceae bacterium]
MFQRLKEALGLDPIKNQTNSYIKRVADINKLESQYEKLSDEQLAAKTPEFKQRLAQGETLDDILPEAFAVVRETSKRVLGLRHYDVQLIGGMALHAGNIAEMRTGEGKTLVGTLPVYLNALSGKGVHLITVNDYLARRDARWMAPIYRFLGLSVGVLQMAARTDNGKKAFLVDPTVTSTKEDQDQLRMVPRKLAYDADITYGTNSEFGFDYLRDNMVMSLSERVQRGHSYAVIDEVDNVLIDEARTPLIISGPASDDVEEYYRVARVVKQLRPEDYEVSEKDRNVYLNDNGLDHIEELLGMVLRDPSRPEEITIEQERMMSYIEQALKAEFIFKRNKDYLVQSGKVIIIDSFTGRLMPGRRWSNGLHQAIEAKEGVKVEPENVTYATITLQNYYRMYDKICGMTGTALTEKEEFYKIYGLDVIPIPTNLEYTARQKGSVLVEKEAKDEDGYKYTYYADPKNPGKALYYKRKDYPDVIYRSEEAKFRAITVEILYNYVKGRPQLIGTASVEHSEFLSGRLTREPLRRLMQIQMMRRAYMNKNNITDYETPLKDFEPFNKALQNIQAGDLRPLARDLGIQLSIEDPDNKALLLQEFRLDEADYPRLLETANGGIPHQVLNARKHDEEGMIIAKAGAFGAVTIATNMAGRGVDIKLGGELEEDVLRDTNRVLSRLGQDPYNMTIEERYNAVMKVDPAEYGVYEESIRAYIEYYENMLKVRALGGLHVIGSERHESRRIDNQLRGRAARQGDPGSSRFFLSLQDEIVRLFGGERLEGMLKRINMFDENIPLEHNMFSRVVEQAQERVEGTNFDVRKHTLEYDDVLNTQRQKIYAQRDQAFLKDDLSEDILDMLSTDLDNRLNKAETEEKWKLAAYLDSVQPSMQMDTQFLPSFTQKMLIDHLRSQIGTAPEKEQLLDGLVRFGQEAYKAEKENGKDLMDKLISGSAENYAAQLQERNANFDLFCETLEDKLKQNEEAVEEGQVVGGLKPADVFADACSFARTQFRLSNDGQRRLAEGDSDVIEELRDQLEELLWVSYRQRLNQLIANRMEGDFAPVEEEIETGDWAKLNRVLMDAVEEGYTSRYERLYGNQMQIRTDLSNALINYKTAELTDQQWSQLIRVMSTGQRFTFDARTHQKKAKDYHRCNFTFFCGSMLEGLSRDQLRTKIWDHYIESENGLKDIFGKIDWSRVRAANVTMGSLPEERQEKLRSALGSSEFEAIRAELPSAISEADTEIIQDVFGKRIQNEVNRSVFLQAISKQWVDYLTQIEGLRVSISMESYAQRNPLVAYKTKAAEMFSELLNDIRQSVVEHMFVSLPRISMMTAVPKPETPETPEVPEKNTEKPAGKKKKK